MATIEEMRKNYADLLFIKESKGTELQAKEEATKKRTEICNGNIRKINALESEVSGLKINNEMTRSTLESQGKRKAVLKLQFDEMMRLRDELLCGKGGGSGLSGKGKRAGGI